MISVQSEDFNLTDEYQLLRDESVDAGAIVTFVGLVREFYDLQESKQGKISGLTLEHYPGMTQKCLQDIVQQAEARWQIQAARVIHRIGELKPQEQIVFVGTASAHRQDAFEAAQFIMDYLKSNAPFWKKQHSESQSEWLNSKQSDEEALDRWS